MSIVPKVPTSNPLPNNEIYKEEEKNDAIKNETGIIAPKRSTLSFGTENFPSPRRAISQKNTDKVMPTEIRNPLLASKLTGAKGTKKKIDPQIVVNNNTNDNLLKNSTLFDFMFISFIMIGNNYFIIANNSPKY